MVKIMECMKIFKLNKKENTSSNQCIKEIRFNDSIWSSSFYFTKNLSRRERKNLWQSTKRRKKILSFVQWFLGSGVECKKNSVSPVSTRILIRRIPKVSTEQICHSDYRARIIRIVNSFTIFAYLVTKVQQLLTRQFNFHSGQRTTYFSCIVMFIYILLILISTNTEALLFPQNSVVQV